jgi:hypothetical protein
MGLQIPALNEQDSSGKVEVAEAIFGQSFNETLVHQLVTRYLAGARAGTKAQKHDLMSVVVVQNHGDKKVRGAQDLVQYAVQSGVRVVLLSLQDQDRMSKS